jgi:VanZ family protein
MKSKNLHVGASLGPGGTSRWRAWGPALAWAAAIFAFSSFPGSAYPATGVPGADKLVHVGLYGLLGALCARGLRLGSSLRGARAMWLAAALAALYGMSDELHQRFVPGRNADWVDVIADAIGALLGAGVMAVFNRRHRRADAGAAR